MHIILYILTSVLALIQNNIRKYRYPGIEFWTATLYSEDPTRRKARKPVDFPET